MNDLIFVAIALGATWGYVGYCLVNGRNIKVVTMSNKYSWTIIITIALLIGAVVIINPSTIKLLMAIGLCLAYILYTCIPSGYDEKGIYVRGRYYPFKKIDETKIEYMDKITRLHFKYRGLIKYIDVNEEDSQLLINLERLYKKGR